jgi:hypothetical protein
MTTARAYLLSSLLLIAGIAPALLSGGARHISSSAFGAPSADFNPKSVRVYVSVFDINAAPAPAREPARVPPPPAPQRSQGSARAATESPRVLSEAETNSKQAARLQAFFGDALLQALRKSGFTAAAQSGSRPEKGVLLKGVFAEVDSQNHNCLAILGSRTPAPQFVLYVGAYNLARPDQPLYRVMTMETCDAHFGPVISLNDYIPMEKYEVSKSLSEEEVRKVCAQIVANLTALLGANPAAFSQ